MPLQLLILHVPALSTDLDAATDTADTATATHSRAHFCSLLHEDQLLFLETSGALGGAALPAVGLRNLTPWTLFPAKCTAVER